MKGQLNDNQTNDHKCITISCNYNSHSYKYRKNVQNLQVNIDNQEFPDSRSRLRGTGKRNRKYIVYCGNQINVTNFAAGRKTDFLPQSIYPRSIL